MANLLIDQNQIIGAIRPMHAMNNGPAHGPEEKRTNYQAYKKLGVPFVRNHDASLSEPYGCQHLVDIHCIFPDFSRNVDDPKSYDFTLTDEYITRLVEMGCGIFYRLGSSIEHWKMKYGTLEPKDHLKWARVCEHIIRHYNKGWAHGFRYNIEYWEIWNEADLDLDDAKDKRTWGGTEKSFFSFYCTAAKHLKSCFPELKIGGPALAFRLDWADRFLSLLQSKNIPLDFFSWHMYSTAPEYYAERASEIRRMLDRHGFDNVPSILNEWNYVLDWSDPQGYIKTIRGMRGASFYAAMMCSMQQAGTVDMLMYYDARTGTTWNGMFDLYTLQPLKGYYPFLMFKDLYRIGRQCLCESSDPDIYAVSASDGKKCSVLITYYPTGKTVPKSKRLTVTLKKAMSFEYRLLDENHDCSPVIEMTGTGFTVTIAPYTVIELVARS